MPTTDTVVIGAGHAGLAVSRLLTEAGVDHVVLDRGRVAERWRTERWDSLHLLTPAWMTLLPLFPAAGTDPDAFIGSGAFVEHLERYAASFDAPVVSGAQVLEVTGTEGGYLVQTDVGAWHAHHVVIATGPHGRPRIPAGLDPERVVAASAYRNPGALAPGGVLVVGASSSGVQIADELARAGREVTLAVGRHTRVPRRYRGLDIYWWLQVTGRLARTIDTMPDPRAARLEPSLQLVGTSGPPQDLDLGVLQHRGVRLVGRVTASTSRLVEVGNDLGRSVADADRRLRRLLTSFDDVARCLRLDHQLSPADPPRPVRVPSPARRIDLVAEGIGTVVVATGYEPDHSFLRVPVSGIDGQIRQVRGRTEAPGLYVVGQRFQHRRDSGLIAGARYDAHDVVDHLVRTRAGRRHVATRLPQEVAG
jgi:putative flavoprotein involved in K+ transport